MADYVGSVGMMDEALEGKETVTTFRCYWKKIVISLQDFIFVKR